jgi:glucans biosynthesis protein
MKCNAKTRSGGLCKKDSIIGKSRCRLHGGLSPSGKAHWNYKHGWRSKENILRVRTVNAELNLLEELALQLGMIDV